MAMLTAPPALAALPTSKGGLRLAYRQSTQALLTVLSSTPCNLTCNFCLMLIHACRWAEAALTAAAASGIAVNTYFYKLIIVPEGTSCGWAGLAYIGCDGSFSCNSWVDARYLMGRTASAATNAQVAFHEQGHNLYLNHAASYDNTGATVEYGERWRSAAAGLGSAAVPPRSVLG